ncbi:hypothetical protein ACFV3G_34895, partial [Streptomyces sp. NPDC059712]
MSARVPGSKSITNRALLLAAAAHGTTRLDAPLVSDDTVAFAEALTALGVDVRTGDGHWTVTGAGGGPRSGGPGRCADAGPPPPGSGAAVSTTKKIRPHR